MKRLGLSLFAAAALIAGCGSDDSTFFANNPGFITTPQGRSLRQIEQLARPGINEALLFTNSFLNTYNAVSPAFVAAALSNPNSQEGLAAADLLAEAQTTLTLLIGYQNAGGIIKTVPAAVGAFLPDVMRVDSSLAIGVNQGAYAFALNNVGSPVAGRKLTDDVIDITYQVLVINNPAVGTDFVNYTPNEGNHATGHQPLSTTFPYLAPAN